MRSLRMAERDAVPARGGSSPPLPGVSGIMPAGITTGARGASLEVRTALAGNLAAYDAVAHEAWPEVSLWDE